MSYSKNKIFISISKNKLPLKKYKKIKNKYLYSFSKLNENKDFIFFFIKVDQSRINKSKILNQLYRNKFSLNQDCCLLTVSKKDGNMIFYRDRFGQVPIYYFSNKDHKVITDDPRLIKSLKISNLKPDLYQNALFVGSHYRYHYLSDHCSFYKNVKTLNNGYFIEIKDNRISKKKYWDLDLKLSPLSTKIDNKIYDDFKYLLSKSIKTKLDRNSNKVFTLSSGIDSSSVISLYKKIFNEKVHAVTTSFNEKTEYDETKDINTITKEKCKKWSKIVIEKNQILEHMNTYLEYSPIPFCTITQLLHGILLKKLRLDIKSQTCISGLGGDEVNCGEIEEYIFFFADLIKIYGLNFNSNIIKMHLDGWIKYHGTNTYPKNLRVLKHEFKRFLDIKHKGYNKLPNDRYFSYIDVFKKNFSKKYFKKYSLPNKYSSYLHNKIYQDLFIEAIPPALYAEYYNSQFYRVKTIRPYLDQDLMNFGISSPHKIKYKNGSTKNIARKALKDILPNDVIRNKKKVGWNAPFDIWLRDSIKIKVDEIINSKNKRICKIYNKIHIKKLLKEHLSGTKNHMLFFWNLINYEGWFKKNFE